MLKHIGIASVMETCFDIGLEARKESKCWILARSKQPEVADIHTLWLGQGLKQKEEVNSGPGGRTTQSGSGSEVASKAGSVA